MRCAQSAVNAASRTTANPVMDSQRRRGDPSSRRYSLNYP